MFRILYFGFCCLLVACGTALPPEPGRVNSAGTPPDDELGTGTQTIDSYTVACSGPYRATAGKAFTIVVYLKDDAPTEAEAVIMGPRDRITFDPPSFTVHKRVPMFVSATINEKGFGTAYVEAIGPGIGDFCDLTIDTGFPGKLKAAVSTLPYNHPLAFSVQITDGNDKPLPVEAPLSMEIQSWDLLLDKNSIPRAGDTAGKTIRVPVAIGSVSSQPVELRSMNWKGGTVHLLATLKTNVGSVVAQDTLSLESEPVWWLPLALAVMGALLYVLYRVTQEENFWTQWKTILPRRLLAGAVAGIIAYLFADSDPLGLKLDTHVLRTYPLLGFLFSFLGIDVLLGKFWPKNTGEVQSIVPRRT
jgi:hypothetical protein